MSVKQEKVLQALRRQVSEQPLAPKMGLDLIEVSPGRSKVTMQTGSWCLNILGGIHGTAIFALIDEAFQAACNAYGTVAVALNMTLTFHQAPQVGEVLTAAAQELHRGGRTATYLISVTDSENRLIATCQALAYRKKERLPFLPDDAA
ncbi:PaaI family thioesterase [Desulfobacca acetoxidans]|uniref:Phenylacetic acid degradation-related protein n=1 Tax=Desulfobacca acetoxidans (strain ATCC 700848 / DSM 11109 / ASRB2) TaxID=880072 RepID=F2NCT3_DESAR|nr:hotdog fold thioesterase [Desulfobacca acetoxidans]AEB09364.1 phenylacetic acid degradation-related protein [Desulfobacca acetoxidans DSM 11109]